MSNTFLGPELSTHEQPKYGAEELKSRLDELIDQRDGQRRANAAFGNMLIDGSNEVYIGRRSGVLTAYTSDNVHKSKKGDIIPAIFVGNGEKTVGNSLVSTLGAVLNLLWHSKNEDTRTKEQKAEHTRMRKIMAQQIAALASELLTNPDSDKLGYIWAFVGDDIDEFVGESLPDEMLNGLVQRAMNYIDYSGEATQALEA